MVPGTLTDLPDHGDIRVNPDCKIEQVAVQRELQFPEDSRFLIAEKIWNQLDKDNQAGLILHEIVYEANAIIGHQNSVRTRYFTSLMASDAFASMPQAEYGDRINYLIMADNQIINWFDRRYMLVQSYDQPLRFQEAKDFCRSIGMGLGFLSEALYGESDSENVRIEASLFANGLQNSEYWSWSSRDDNMNPIYHASHPDTPSEGYQTPEDASHYYLCSKRLDEM